MKVKLKGVIKKITDADARRYEVDISDRTISARGTDFTKYAVDQLVALAKMGEEFVIVPVDLSE